MQIGGLQKLSLIDYPGVPAAIVFTQGCNMRCPYCHNPQLVYPHLFETSIRDEDVCNFLKKRQKLPYRLYSFQINEDRPLKNVIKSTRYIP